MAPGHHHRRAVARPDVRQREQDVDLAAAERPARVPVLAAHRAPVPARVQAEEAAAAAYRGEALVDEQPLRLGVGVGLPAVAADQVDPGRVVDELFERLSSFDDVLELAAAVAVVVRTLHVAVPLAVFERGYGVERRVEPGDVRRVDRSAQDQVSAQVEQVVKGGARQWFHGFLRWVVFSTVRGERAGEQREE